MHDCVIWSCACLEGFSVDMYWSSIKSPQFEDTYECQWLRPGKTQTCTHPVIGAWSFGVSYFSTLSVGLISSHPLVPAFQRGHSSPSGKTAANWAPWHSYFQLRHLLCLKWGSFSTMTSICIQCMTFQAVKFRFSTIITSYWKWLPHPESINVRLERPRCCVALSVKCRWTRGYITSAEKILNVHKCNWTSRPSAKVGKGCRYSGTYSGKQTSLKLSEL